MKRRYTPTPPHVISADLSDFGGLNISIDSVPLATVHPASEQYATQVLEAEIDNDGRSEWLWLRLTDGTLMLGVFPRGETYMAMEPDSAYPTPHKKGTP
jgi:hypothetical protein